MESLLQRATAPRSATRQEQREATRTRLLHVAVTVLIERGVAGTTTLEVQQRAAVGRGTLLHHFATHADLLSATVAELVRRNEENVRNEAKVAATPGEPLAYAILTLANAAARPSYLAELELWAVARTDERLRDALRLVERGARQESDRVVGELFAPVVGRPGYAVVVALSVEFVRGLALSGILRTDSARRELLLRQWIDAASLLLDRPPQAGNA